MPTEFEIVGRREMPGLDQANPRALSVVIFYRKAGDPNYADFVVVPSGRATDSAIAAAIQEKERSKGPGATKRVTVE